jgi:hypothetical protein
MKVVSIVDSVRDEFDGTGASRADISRSIGRRFDIESVSEITAKEVKLTTVEGGFEVAVHCQRLFPGGFRQASADPPIDGHRWPGNYERLH